MILEPFDLSIGAALLAHVLYGIPGIWPAVVGRPAVTLHNGDAFSTADEAPRLERLRRSRVVTGEGAVSAELVATDLSGVVAWVDEAHVPGWFAVETEPAFIELEPREFESYLEEEGLFAALQARRREGATDLPGREIYSKHAKVALGTGLGFLPGAIGLPIEIVPAPERSLLTGDELRVSVLFRGQGAPGLQLRAMHRASEDATPRLVATCVTDGEGGAAICVDAPGLWRLHTIAMEPHSDLTAAHWRSHWASLTFRI